MQKKEFNHFIRHEGLEYGRAMCRGEEVALTLDLSLPVVAKGPVPLVVWLHAGGFRSGDKAWAGHLTDSRWLTKAGYAYASVNYRLKAKVSDLSASIARRMDALEPHCQTGFSKDLSGTAALAAMEDAVTALAWLSKNSTAYSLSDWIALGGNSAGAITAFNVAHLSGFFGLPRPAIRGIISISGGFAYPRLYAPAMVPVHALHNPQDKRVDIAAIREIAGIGGDAVELVESDRQQHGRVRLHSDEPVREAYARILGFLDRVKNGNT